MASEICSSMSTRQRVRGVKTAVYGHIVVCSVAYGCGLTAVLV